MITDKKVEDYLKEHFGVGTTLSEIQQLGSGLHGTTVLLKFRTSGTEKQLIMKTLKPSEFGHDHFSDRAQVFLLANDNYNNMQRHVKAVDIVGADPDRFISLKNALEFYIFMEVAEGKSYFDDLDAILNKGILTDSDRQRAKDLALFIAGIHSEKYIGKRSSILYKRRIRDLVGHGECIMGIIDTYEEPEFVSEAELIDYAGKCLLWWGKIRNRSERLCQVHGDYHPGNIWFKDDNFIVLDRSRGSWGDPADDVSCLAVNYIHYALKERGTFEGPFSELFTIFLKNYLDKSHDYGFFEVSQPFFAFRILVIANPRFYPQDSAEVKRKLLNLGHSILGSDKFEIDNIADYLKNEYTVR